MVSSLLPSSRDGLVELGLSRPEATHFLFLDSDMVFPRHTLERLLVHDLDVVACNYAVKQVPPYPVTTYLNGAYVYTNDDSTGLEQVGGIGMGVALFKRRVFEEIVRPRFLVAWRERQKSYVGEDIFLCNLLHTAKIPLIIDHDLSKEVGHMGQFIWWNIYSGFNPATPPYDIGLPAPGDTLQVAIHPEPSETESSQTSEQSPEELP
jgi:hypothetical protein